jgi:AAA domain
MSERNYSDHFGEQVDEPHSSSAGEKPGGGNGKDHGKGAPFILFDDIENVPKTWLADGFLGAGEMSCWYGEPGSGKSVLAEDFGLHVAGKFREWLGREINTHGAVIYIALERPNLVKRRAVAFKIKHKVHGLPFAIVSEAHDFRSPKTATLILQTVAEVQRMTGQKVVLIILDTISRALCGGDENSPKDMGALIGTLGQIQEATGAHMLLVHHVPHDVERMRGHGSLLGAMDTTAFVQKSTGVRTATVIKANDSDEGQRVAFTLESVELAAVGRRVFTAPVVVGSPDAPVTGAGKRAGKLNANQQRFIDILTTAAIEAPANVKGTDTVPRGVTAVERDMLKRYLVTKGWIEEVDSGRARAKVSDMINGLAGKKVVGATKQYVWVIP